MIVKIYKKIITNIKYIKYSITTNMDTIINQLNTSIRKNQRKNFYESLQKFTYQKSQKTNVNLDEIKLNKFLDINPPNTPNQFENLLYFSQRNRFQLTIQQKVKNVVNFNELKIDQLVRFYHLLGYNLLDNLFNQCQIELKKRLQKQFNIKLSELSIKLILNVKYHRKIIQRRKFQQYSIPVYLIPYLNNQILKNISPLNLSYIILYYSACELQYYRGFSANRHPIKVLMNFLNKQLIQKLPLSDNSQRIILNYVAANIYMTNQPSLSNLLQTVQNYIESMSDNEFDYSFAGSLLNYQHKRLRLFNKNLIRENIIKRAIKVYLNKQLQLNQFNKIQIFLDQIHKYPLQLLPIKNIQQSVLQLAKNSILMMNGIQLLALNKINIENIIDIIIKTKLIGNQSDQIRWAIILNHVNRQKYLTFIEVYQNKIESFFRTIAHVSFASLRKSLLYNTESFKSFCHKVVQQISKIPKIQLNDFQYFNFLMILMCSQKNHNFILQNLKQLKLNQKKILQKKFLAAAFQNNQKFNQNAIQCMYKIIKTFDIHPDAFIGYITENRELLYLLINYNNQKFYDTIKNVNKLDEIFKIAYFIIYCNLDNPDKILSLAQKFPNYKDNWYNFVKIKNVP